MKKNLALIVSLLFGCFTSAFAQDELKIAEAKNSKQDTRVYNILSLDDKQERIKILPDYLNHKLIISCSKSVIKINDYWGVQAKVQLLRPNFIRIDYAVRGGTNLALQNMLLICIAQSKLYEAMHILERSTWDSGDLKMDYNVTTALTGDNKNNFRLNVGVNDNVKSKTDPEQNYSYNNKSSLAFDAHRNAFYSIKQTIYDRFDNRTKKKIEGNFPVIMLGKEIYYLINGSWYQSADTSNLHELAI